MKGKLMKHAARLAAGLLLGWVAAVAAEGGAAADKVAQIQQCMRANVPPALQIKQFVLKATDKAGGQRTMKGRLYALREDGLVRSMLKLEEPVDMRGAAYLMRESRTAGADEMYVFLPALNKVRRIVGSSQDNALFGTDISYADIKQINHAFSGGEVTLEKELVKHENRDAWVLALRPAAAQQSRFTLIRTWVDQKTCVALRAEFADAGGVRKRFTAPAAALRQSGPYWYVAEGLMEDLAAKTSTSISVTGVTSSDDLAGRYFNPRTFHVGS